MTERHRLLVVLLLFALVGAALVALVSTALTRGLLRERTVDRVGSEAALVAAWIESGPTTDLQTLAVRAAGRIGARVTLIAPDGTVVADSARDAAGVAAMDNHAERPEIRAARTEGQGNVRRTSATTNVVYFYSARLVPGNGPVKYVRLALPASDVERDQTRSTLIIAVMVPAALLLTSALGYAALRRLSRPIERMAAAVERSADGHPELDLPRDGGAEIDQLGLAVRRMQQVLLERVDQLDAERALLSSVIEGMREGLLLVDADRRVRLANGPLRSTLELRFDPAGHLLTEVVRHPDVLAVIETALDRGIETRDSILRLPSGRSFQLRATPFRRGNRPDPVAALVLFFDVTRLEKLEGIRREFVGNVSHELRTPLTSIKAFVETLEEGGLDDRKNARRFLGIIRKHADRMGHLIHDLTDLSLIETGSIALDIQEIDAAEVVEGVLEQLGPLSRKYEVGLVSELPATLTVRADRRRLEQLVTNLVDNALKFSRPGGSVRIRAEDGPAHVVLSVHDDGIGIPGSSVDKIFHRFYQENRDESREMGGTGLGLSIVKHLMRLHDGQVRVESELGRGSTFFLEFPK